MQRAEFEGKQSISEKPQQNSQMASDPQFDLFFSYNHDSSPEVRELYAKLKERSPSGSTTSSGRPAATPKSCSCWAWSGPSASSASSPASTPSRWRAGAQEAPRHPHAGAPRPGGQGRAVPGRDRVQAQLLLEQGAAQLVGGRRVREASQDCRSTRLRAGVRNADVYLSFLRTHNVQGCELENVVPKI